MNVLVIRILWFYDLLIFLYVCMYVCGKDKSKDGVKFMVSPRNSSARSGKPYTFVVFRISSVPYSVADSGSIRELILSANNFAVPPDMIAFTPHISPEQCADNSKHTDTPKTSAAVPPLPSLIFSPTLIIHPV